MLEKIIAEFGEHNVEFVDENTHYGCIKFCTNIDERLAKCGATRTEVTKSGKKWTRCDASLFTF